MGMELRHTFTVPASPETTWALLTDLQQVGGCFPGATVTETDGDTFAGTVKVKLGPIQMQYAGTGAFLERDDTAHRAVIEGKGKDKRGNGTAGATATLSLTPEGDGTSVEVITDLTVTGKPAQFGRGVMQDVSDKLLGQFVACLESSLGPAAPDETEAPTVEAETPSTAGSPVTAAPIAGAAAASSTPETDLAPGPSGSEAPPLAEPVRTRPPTASAPVDDAIDLGDLVGPVLRERYGMVLGAGLVGLVLGILIGRRHGGG